MNFNNIIPTTIFVMALLPAAWVNAAEKPAQTQPTVSQSSAVAGKVKVVPVPKKAADKKRQQRKPKKRYSKATLSAFQPVPLASSVPSVADRQSAAFITLSPLVQKDMLHPEPPPSSAGTGSFAIPDIQTAYDEDSSNVQHERSTTAVGESNVLGQESVSVIDRFADKPKARPLANGPLRMRMKDSGVRASVQIPLTTEK